MQENASNQVAIGLEGGTSFLDHSQSTVKQNQCNPDYFRHSIENYSIIPVQKKWQSESAFNLQQNKSRDSVRKARESHLIDKGMQLLNLTA